MKRHQSVDQSRSAPEIDAPETWPRCVCTGGTCLAWEISRQLGVTIAAEVLHFIANAEPGARLTLQRNQSGITTQVVSAVHRAEPESVTFDDLFRLRGVLRNGHNLGNAETSVSLGD